MRLLVSEDGYNVIPDPKIFLIMEFEKLRDSRKDLNTLTKELGYLYFMYHPESDFMDQTVESFRHIDVVKYLGLPSGYQPDQIMKQAIDAYLYLSQTSESKMLQTARKSVAKLEKQIDEIDLDERDKNGKPVWDLKKYQDVVKSMPETMASLQKVEDLYVRKKEEAARLKGDKEAAIFEDMEDDFDN